MSKHAAKTAAKPSKPATSSIRFKRSPKAAANAEFPVIDHGPETELHETDHADFAGQPEPEPASSTSFTTPAADATGNPPTPSATQEKHNMADLKLVLSKAARKSARLVIYNIEGRTGSVQFLSTLFGGGNKSQGNPPETLTLVGEFAEPKVKEPKVKLTPEERKARLASLPKLTLAEKVAKAEARMEKLRQKLAAEAEAEASAQ